MFRYAFYKCYKNYTNYVCVYTNFLLGVEKGVTVHYPYLIASEVLEYIEKWIHSTSSVIIQNLNLNLNSTCPTVIAGFNSLECPVQVDMENTAVIVGSVIATSIIIFSGGSRKNERGGFQTNEHAARVVKFAHNENVLGLRPLPVIRD